MKLTTITELKKIVISNSTPIHEKNFKKTSNGKKPLQLDKQHLKKKIQLLLSLIVEDNVSHWK